MWTPGDNDMPDILQLSNILFHITVDDNDIRPVAVFDNSPVRTIQEFGRNGRG